MRSFTTCASGAASGSQARADATPGHGTIHRECRRAPVNAAMKKADLDLIRARYDAVNAHALDRFQGSMPTTPSGAIRRRPVRPGALGRCAGGWRRGPRAVLSDRRWQLEDLFGEGDKLSAKFTFTGKHRGPLADGRGNALPGPGRRSRSPASASPSRTARSSTRASGRPGRVRGAARRTVAARRPPPRGPVCPATAASTARGRTRTRPGGRR